MSLARNRRFKELETLNRRTQKIIVAAHASKEWGTAYDLIFSNAISRLVFELVQEIGLSLQYYDPDTTYEEDSIAFSSALQEFVDKNKGFFET